MTPLETVLDLIQKKDITSVDRNIKDVSWDQDEAKSILESAFLNDIPMTVTSKHNGTRRYVLGVEWSDPRFKTPEQLADRLEEMTHEIGQIWKYFQGSDFECSMDQAILLDQKSRALSQMTNSLVDGTGRNLARELKNWRSQ